MTKRSADFVNNGYRWIGADRERPGHGIFIGPAGVLERWTTHDDEPGRVAGDRVMKGKTKWFSYLEDV